MCVDGCSMLLPNDKEKTIEEEEEEWEEVCERRGKWENREE